MSIKPAVAALAMTLNVSVFATTDEEVTVTHPPTPLTWEERQERAAGFRDAAAATRRGTLLLQDMERTNRSDLVVHRKECVAALRKANRDARLPAAFQCHRLGLMMQRDRLKQVEQYFSSAPGISDRMRSTALVASDKLIDAIETIAIAIDASVYRSLEELAEAKVQLTKLYWEPYWLERTHVHVDRVLSWIAHFLIEIQDLRTNGDAPTEAKTTLRRASVCFEEGESFMLEVLNTKEYKNSKFLFSQALIHLEQCAELLREAKVSWDRPESTS